MIATAVNGGLGPAATPIFFFRFKVLKKAAKPVLGWGPRELG